MKRLLSFMGSVSILSLSVTTVVACGSPGLENKPTFPKDEYMYELFGNYFLSEEDAIEYYMNPENGLITETEKDFVSSLYLGEEIFYEATDMYNYISQNIPINKITTNKKVDQYVIDGMNQLSPNVAASDDDSITVYRDANGKAIFEYNPENGEQAVLDSYYKDIKTGYYADGTEFNSTNDLFNHFETKFINNPSTIEAQDLYNYNGLSYSKKDLESQITKDIRAQYEYNGQVFLDSEINQPGILEPTFKDEMGIEKYAKSPGKYLIEQKSNSQGTYTGDLIIESNTNLEQIVYDETKWTKTSTKSKNFLDVVESTVISGITMSAAPLIGKLRDAVSEEKTDEKLKYCFLDPENIDQQDLFMCFTSENNYNEYTNLLSEYELYAESSNILDKINSIESLDTMPKIVIYLYQMREAFRYTNINVLHNQKLNEIMYDVFLNFYVDCEPWERMINTLGKNDISFILDLLIDKNAFFNIIETKTYKEDLMIALSDFSKVLEMTYSEKIMNETIDYLEGEIQKAAEMVGAVVKDMTATLMKAAEEIPVLGSIIAFLNDFSMQTTVTYELKLPGSQKVLTYEMTNWFFENKQFNPEEVFRVFQIKEPKENEVFYLDGRYFPTYEQAYRQLERNIILKTVDQGPSGYFLNSNNSKIFATKQEAIEYWKNYYIENEVIEKQYTDFLGGVYETQQKAFDEMNRKIKSPEELDKMKFYSYSYGDNFENVITLKDEEEIKEFVKENTIIESKQVTLLDLEQAKYDFDKLYNLSDFNTEIYHFNLYGMDYYFKDEINATYKILQILGYKNILMEIKVTTYELNNLKFDNIVEYQQYLYENIQKIKGEDVNPQLGVKHNV